MSELKHIIYQITNLLNNMIYIGKHSTTTPYDMKNYWGSNTHLNSSIKRHGKKNFKRETLFVFDLEEEAYNKEAEIVDKDFIEREDTYNFQTGGKGGFTCSEETRKKISESLSGENNPFYGKYHTEETKKRMSESQSGENNWNCGKHLSGETKKKLREANGLTDKIFKQRLLDIKNEPKTRGWKAKLAKLWGISRPTTGEFITKYAPSKDIEEELKIRG